MLVNICMKIHEDSLNGSQVIERTLLRRDLVIVKNSKGNNSKSINARLMVLALCTSSNTG